MYGPETTMTQYSTYSHAVARARALVHSSTGWFHMIAYVYNRENKQEEHKHSARAASTVHSMSNESMGCQLPSRSVDPWSRTNSNGSNFSPGTKIRCTQVSMLTRRTANVLQPSKSIVTTAAKGNCSCVCLNLSIRRLHRDFGQNS